MTIWMSAVAWACTESGEDPGDRIEVLSPPGRFANVRSPEQPIVVDVGTFDAEAWIETVTVVTEAGDALAFEAEIWENVPRMVSLWVVDPPVDAIIRLGPNRSGAALHQPYYDASLPDDTTPPDWGRSSIRFVKEDTPCQQTQVTMEVQPPLEDVWYEVIGSDGRATVGPALPVVERVGLDPAESYRVTPVDGFGNRGETREIAYEGPTGGCSTTGGPMTFWTELLLRRR